MKNKVLRRLKNRFLMTVKGSDIVPEGTPRLKQKALFTGKGKIKFGENVQIGFYPSPMFHNTYAHFEARNPSSEIYIGDGTIISNNCYIVSNGDKIHIGKNCRIGLNFQCVNSDFHSTNAEFRDDPEHVSNKPVIIGDNAFIGNNTIILKGVKIGDNVVIGAGSVVVRDIPSDSLAVGNPAKVIKKLEGGES